MESSSPRDPESTGSASVGEEAPPRKGVALCLSGGGYRATLFHLGALRRLNECGLLGWIDTIVSVSGGSITAAHLARRVTPWPAAGDVVENWEENVARPLRAFCAIDVRTPAVWQGLMHPFRAWKRGGIPPEVVEGALSRWVHPGALRDLPVTPKFVFQASDIDGGTLFRFQRGYLIKGGQRYTTKPDDTIARAVAASACFPPVFAPIPASDDARRFTKDPKEPGGLVPLSDGGLYDNLGLQPVIQHHQHILISDAGAPWDYSARPRGVTGLIGRYPTVLMRQIQNLRMREWINLRDNRWLNPNRRIEGAWWSLSAPKPPKPGAITNAKTEPRPVGYPEAFLEEYVVKCRTDLNSFTDAEARVLENAGYMNCAIALHDRIDPPLPARPFPAPQWPHPALAQPEHVAPALRDIANRLPGGLLRFVWKMLRNHQVP